MKYFAYLLLLSIVVEAHEPIHSSVTTYYENINFKNSIQKMKGNLLGVGGDIHMENSAYKFVYEHAKTETKQPPLQKDLNTDKIFLKYGYQFENSVDIHFNYINILDDNIAPTAHGESFGGGVGYSFDKNRYINFTQFFTRYKEFNVFQSDLKFEYKMSIQSATVKFTSLSNYILLDNYAHNTFSKKADKEYFTTALKIHSHYKSYHLGAALFLGKRAFAIMDNGFKIQHHAMEFNKAYTFGFGKSFSNFILRFQYIYQRAKEIPINNENVEVNNYKVIANYKF